MEQESAFAYEYIRGITGLLADGLPLEANEEIRFLLEERWLFIKKTAWAYPRHPFLPINQLCLQIAEQIAGEDEAICQILMPGIRKIGRIPASTRALKENTEENGHFPVHKFILAKKEGVLLPLETMCTDAQEALNTRGSVFNIETPSIFKEFLTFLWVLGTSVDKIAEFTAPCVSRFEDLSNLIVNPDLLKALLLQIAPRADGFLDIVRLYPLLNVLTEEEQKKFINKPLLNKMISQIESLVSYERIKYAFKPALMSQVDTILMAKMRNEVHGLADLKALVQRFSGGGPILGLLREFKNNLDQYFDNDIEEALKFYTRLDSDCQDFLEGWLLEFCSQWITPDGFESHSWRISEVLKNKLLAKLSENTGSFADYLRLLDKWSRCPRLLPKLNAVNKERLKAWVTSEECLEQLIEKMPAGYKEDVILEFPQQVSSRSFLYRYLRLIPGDSQSGFLLAVNLKSIITTVLELEFVLALLNTKGKKAQILARFQAGDLKNCTPQRFAELQKSFTVNNQDIIEDITELKLRCQYRGDSPWGLEQLDILKRNLLDSDSRIASIALIRELYEQINQRHSCYCYNRFTFRGLEKILARESARISYDSDQPAADNGVSPNRNTFWETNNNNRPSISSVFSQLLSPSTEYTPS
ncbi:hypothetical protein [Legionella birminghamensis]|nr:hypothetical protein [Legionella birminghamensis]